MTFFYGPARCWARKPVAVKEMVNFSASCDVQHIADFSRICAMCDVHGGPIPAYISNKKLFVTVCASRNAGRDRPQKPLNLFLIFSKANLFPCSQTRPPSKFSVPVVHLVVLRILFRWHPVPNIIPPSTPNSAVNFESFSSPKTGKGLSAGRAAAAGFINCVQTETNHNHQSTMLRSVWPQITMTMGLLSNSVD